MFNTEGVFRLVSFPPIPMLNAEVSAKAKAGLWQLAQLMVESLESIFSENSFLPRAALVVIAMLSFSRKELIMAIAIIAAGIEINSLFIDANLQEVAVKIFLYN